MNLKEKLLTINEVLEIAKISRHTLYRDTRDGIIPSIKFGKNVRYRESDVMRYAEEKSQSNKVKYYINKKQEEK